MSLDGSSNAPFPNPGVHLTLTGYDASNNPVASDTVTQTVASSPTLTVTSGTNNIKSFTLVTDALNTGRGVIFTNIVWGCS